MRRSGQERLDSISPAVARGEAFRERVAQAAGDVLQCADLMAEAITMWREANGLEVVGRDWRVTASIEDLQAYFCADAARAAYVKARGRNASDTDQQKDETP